MRENPALTVETAQMGVILMALPAGRDVPAAPILMRTENFIFWYHPSAIRQARFDEGTSADGNRRLIR